ncbi:MAG TPA: energy-coupled thiamine transporter ThiT [Tissierellales bacterium]|nr:energy-coupled thiamine transporter ThiT [Tissierellales bacterium]
MNNKKWSVNMLAEGGVMIALSVLLSYIIVYQAPHGGSVTAGSMIPIMFFAMRWGVGPGVFVGAIYGVLHFILKPYFYHPVQFLLDYPIAYGFLGMAGIATIKKTKDMDGKDYFKVVFAVLLAIFGRMVSHLLSGIIFFAEYAGDQNPWIYSIIYNGQYLLPEFIISSIILVLLWKPLSRIEK